MAFTLEAPLAKDIQFIGEAVARLARAGDLVMLTGPLGAGKTTMTQGIARGLGVRGKVSSPTFVIAQIHRGTDMNLVHVDAYRLESIEELDALDLDTSLDEALTVVEWGAGKVEVLSDDRLEIVIERPEGSEAGLDPEDLFEDAPRTLTFTGHGMRGEGLADLIRSEFPDAVVNAPDEDEA